MNRGFDGEFKGALINWYYDVKQYRLFFYYYPALLLEVYFHSLGV